MHHGAWHEQRVPLGRARCVLAASSLLIGALLVMWKPIRQHTLGLVMAFGAGVLISAVAFELVADAIE
ncbi:MAG: hypothetical protein ACXVHK_27445, partial [Solirubrobacteraceae bacterium]